MDNATCKFFQPMCPTCNDGIGVCMKSNDVCLAEDDCPYELEIVADNTQPEQGGLYGTHQ